MTRETFSGTAQLFRLDGSRGVMSMPVVEGDWPPFVYEAVRPEPMSARVGVSPVVEVVHRRTFRLRLLTATLATAVYDEVE